MKGDTDSELDGRESRIARKSKFFYDDVMQVFFLAPPFFSLS
jgi:hypothetical protein